MARAVATVESAVREGLSVRSRPNLKLFESVDGDNFKGLCAVLLYGSDEEIKDLVEKYEAGEAVRSGRLLGEVK